MHQLGIVVAASFAARTGDRTISCRRSPSPPESLYDLHFCWKIISRATSILKSSASARKGTHHLQNCAPSETCEAPSRDDVSNRRRGKVATPPRSCLAGAARVRFCAPLSFGFTATASGRRLPHAVHRVP